MGRLLKRLLNLKQCRHEENDDEEEIDENEERALIFVIALIYCRFPESLSQDFAVLIGDDPPSYYYMIHLAFEVIRPIIADLAKKSEAQARE